MLIPLRLFASDIYGYVDENGSVKFTNINPPTGANVVITGKDEESRQEREERIERKQRHEEEERHLEKMERIKSERREKEQQFREERVTQEREGRDRERRSKVSAEINSLNYKRDSWVKKCESLKPAGYVVQSECEDRAKNRYKEVISLLNTSSEYYFENDYRIDRETRDSLEPWYREKLHLARSMK